VILQIKTFGQDVSYSQQPIAGNNLYH